VPQKILEIKKNVADMSHFFP